MMKNADRKGVHRLAHKLKQGFIKSFRKLPVAEIGHRVSTISLISPKSQRFSQLSFSGFRPQGKTPFEKIANILRDFGVFLWKYIYRKVFRLIKSLKSTFLLSVEKTQNLKAWMVKKLIWSRGKLGRPIATAVVMGAAFIVFMFGEVFNSSKYVNTQEISPDYLSTVSDIIPRKSIALTTIPDSRKQSEPFNYTVESGDSLSSVGNKFKISLDALKYVNNLNDGSVLRVGQVLVIPPISGLIHKVESGDSLAAISSKYDVPAQAIADFNYILDTSSLAVGTELVIPGAKVPQQVIVVPTPIITSPIANVDPNAGGGWCIWPTPAQIITQYFSWYHNGLDIAAAGWLPPIYACGSGTVIRSGWDPFGLGLHVRIDHGNGYETVYGHMSSLEVSYGQSVSQGDVIGIMGSTGRSTGPHVHFIIKYNGVPQNPMSYIQ